MMMGNLKGALSSFRGALKIDEGCEKALNGIILLFNNNKQGIIHVQILENQLEDAEKQLEFLIEMHNSTNSNQKSTDLSFLKALLNSRLQLNIEKSNKQLGEAIEYHFKSLQDVPFG